MRDRGNAALSFRQGGDHDIHREDTSDDPDRANRVSPGDGTDADPDRSCPDLVSSAIGEGMGGGSEMVRSLSIRRATEEFTMLGAALRQAQFAPVS